MNQEMSMPTTITYRTKATATGGRDGRAVSEDGALSVALSVPKAMGGPGKAGATNPEQLFAAGYAACFGSAVAYVARRKQLDPGEVTVTAEVGIGPDASGGFGLEVALTVTLPGLPRDQARSVVEEAHRVCPYSNATRGNIEVALTIA
jgi:osmotically inducible protein OsmC